MNLHLVTTPTLLSALAAILALTAIGTPSAAAPGADKVFLAPHRAVYDLTLSRAGRSRGIDTMHGRILYDFSGSACEGYTLRFRQVSRLESGEGRSVLSDLRSTTWEDGAAKKFRFNSENFLNEARTEAVDGHSERGGKAMSVTLSKPSPKKFRVPAGTVLPTEHMRRIVQAARAGKTILEFPVYDGSDDGQKLYNTLTVIGKPIRPGENPPQDAGAKIPQLAQLTRWPVTISYFERVSEVAARSSEQTPVYALSFELYENGISRALILYYSDFTLVGEMTALEMKKAKACP